MAEPLERDGIEWVEVSVLRAAVQDWMDDEELAAGLTLQGQMGFLGTRARAAVFNCGGETRRENDWLVPPSAWKAPENSLMRGGDNEPEFSLSANTLRGEGFSARALGLDESLGTVIFYLQDISVNRRDAERIFLVSLGRELPNKTSGSGAVGVGDATKSAQLTRRVFCLRLLTVRRFSFWRGRYSRASDDDGPTGPPLRH